MGTIRVRATVHTLGLEPGQSAEIEVTPQVEGAVSLQQLVVLDDAPVEAPEKAPEAPESVPEAPAAPPRNKRRRDAEKTADED